MDDDLVDLVLAHVGEHPFQSGTIGSASAFAAIDEFLDDDGAERGRLTTAGLPRMQEVGGLSVGAFLVDRSVEAAR